MIYFTVLETVRKTSDRLGKNWHILCSPCETFCPCHFPWGVGGIYSHLTVKYLRIVIHLFLLVGGSHILPFSESPILASIVLDKTMEHLKP